MGLVMVATVPAAAPVGVSCLMSTSYTDRLVDAWIAEDAPAPVHQPTPTVTPTLSPYMDVKAGEGPPPIGEERVTTGELARYLVGLKGCDSVM
ncbi:hypothetical protein [Nonomuraea bangladeshensis]|uniref:hypothetical protein n=1 Tax=Nonomuraea bangladeshensis TaxID=404385 RepID=UPI003C2F25E9